MVNVAVTTSNYPYVSLTYNSTHFVIQVYTTNNAYAGNWMFYVKATFTGGYYSSYSVTQTFPLEIKACTTDTITPSTITDKYYLVGAT